LKARAHRAMLEAGFQPDFPPPVVREVASLAQTQPQPTQHATRDLRALLWSSIDNEQSRDLDQVEYIERLPEDTLRLLVGIADVDSKVTRGSATDIQAAAEGTSVYTGVQTFPLLPEVLSTDLTSLVQDQDRLAIVIELHIPTSGEALGRDIYPA